MNELIGKSIIITGSTGLIGSNLVKSIGVDCEVITPHVDLSNLGFMMTFPKADYIIHSAGYAQPSKFLADPIKTIKLNTCVLMELFKKLKPNGKLLFLSSSEVYSGVKPPYRETDIGTTNPSHKRACYIESKRCGEAICNQLGGAVARVSLVYGPGSRLGDTRVLNDFIQQGLKGRIKLMDEGKAQRTYCYVSDAVSMIWSILFQGTGTYNVGGHSKVSIKELALRIADILNVPVELGDKGLEGAPEDVCLDMTKTEKEFGKTEYVGLTEGLTKTIEWYKQIGG